MYYISLAAQHYPFPAPMPSQSKVKQYQDHEVDFSVLSDRAFEVFGKRPFRWQLEAAQAILCGRDVVLDVVGSAASRRSSSSCLHCSLSSSCFLNPSAASRARRSLPKRELVLGTNFSGKLASLGHRCMAINKTHEVDGSVDSRG